MEIFLTFLTRNFILLCVSAIMLINCFQYYKRQPRISFYSILIVVLTLLLALFQTLEDVADYYISIPLATAASALGYIIRPVVVFVFVIMTTNYKKKTTYLFLAIPLLFSTIVYLLALNPTIGQHVFYYTAGEGKTDWHGGGPLRFSSHIVGAIYLFFLSYVSIADLKAKHLIHGLAIIACIVFVFAAVLLETFAPDSANLHILNSTIAVSTLTYFLFSYVEKSQLDALTKLYNREMYYRDVPKMKHSITGVVQFDLNGLKYINDNLGHLEGDKALVEIAKIIQNNLTRDMYAYRLGGDEYIVLANDTDEKVLQRFIEDVKAGFAKTTYHCSVGYSYRAEKSMTIEDLMKEAEKKMYLDKEEFYKTADFDRRKR